MFKIYEKDGANISNEAFEMFVRGHLWEDGQEQVIKNLLVDMNIDENSYNVVRYKSADDFKKKWADGIARLKKLGVQ